MADSLDHLSSGRTQIEWLSSLNTEFQPKTNYRRTSIICTIGELVRQMSAGLRYFSEASASSANNWPIGPKTNSVEKINMLRKAGLNVVRMNFSHGSYEYHQSVIDHSREAERQMPGRPLAIALDTVRR